MRSRSTPSALSTADAERQRPADPVDHPLRCPFELPPGDPDDAEPERLELRVPAPVPLERHATGMELEAVELGHEACLPPHQVDLEAGDALIGLGLRAASAAQQRQETSFGGRTGEGRVRGGRDQLRQEGHSGSPTIAAYLIDELLGAAGSHKSKLLAATIYLANMAFYSEMNEAWDAWVDPQNTPARATVEARLVHHPKWGIEIMCEAALP